MDYVSQNHSKHLLMVHLIFVCKYRKKLLVRYGEEFFGKYIQSQGKTQGLHPLP